MAEAIENVIDDWLRTKFIAEMGSGSSYGTLKLSYIDTGILRTPKDWESWTFPALGYSNRISLRTADQHIGGVIHVSKPITYTLTFVTYGAQSEAIRSSRTLLARAEVLFNVLSTTSGALSSLVSDYNTRCTAISWFNGSRTQKEKVEAGMSRLRSYIDPASANKWFCAQDFSVVFHCTTGV